MRICKTWKKRDVICYNFLFIVLFVISIFGKAESKSQREDYTINQKGFFFPLSSVRMTEELISP